MKPQSISCSKAGQRGGGSKSEKKIAAARRNLAKARAKLAELRRNSPVGVLNGVTDDDLPPGIIDGDGEWPPIVIVEL